VKNRFRNPVLKTLSSLRLAAILMAIFAAAIGVATFLEARYGRDGAYALVYAAPWFEALLGLLTLNLLLSLIGRFPYPPRLFGFFLVHVGMIVILVGAGITRYFGYEGSMPIREGQSSNVVYTTQNYVQARQDGTLQSFPVRMFRPGPQNEHAKITLGGQDFTLGVSEFYPGAEEAWVPGPDGQGEWLGNA